MTSRTDRQCGFTLLELVVVVAVAGILLVTGVPALQDMVRNNRLVTETNDLVAHLNLARSEAIKRRTRVAICSSTAAGAAVPACDGGTDWDTGWVVFVDADSDGVVDSAADVIRRGWERCRRCRNHPGRVRRPGRVARTPDQGGRCRPPATGRSADTRRGL